MNKQRKIWSATVAGALVVSGLSLAAVSQAADGSVAPVVASTVQEPAPGTDAAIAWEALMSAEGEYAAAAAYAAVIDKYGKVQPYVNIRAAERRHVAALARQLERYGVEVPANPWMKKIPAPASLEEAAQAWATGEVDNVKMYDNLIAQTSDPQLVRVLTNLRNSSLKSHLPMFEAAAENGGTLTKAQMAEFQGGQGGQGGQSRGDNKGRGNGSGQGPGQGAGQGNGQGRGWSQA